MSRLIKKGNIIMVTRMFRKLGTINPWHFIWIVILGAEVLTLMFNSLQSFMRWGYISRDLIEIGIIDSLIVPLIATPVIIYILKAANEKLKQEITERKLSEDALRDSEERYRELFENASDLIQIVRPDGHFLYVNRAWRETLGYNEDEITHLTIFDVIADDCGPHCSETFQRVMSEGKVPKIESVFVAKDDRRIIVEGSASCKYRNGKPESTRCMFRDVTVTKKMEEELQILLVTDELTGLYNRRGFFTLAEQHLKMASRQGTSMFMLFADLDNLKSINDAFGHKEGDQALIEIAAIFKETYRESDIIARIGGDEFVVFPVGTTEERLEEITNRFQEKLAMHNEKGNRKYKLTISCGIAHYNSESPCSLNELLLRADKLMYEQKKQKTRAES